MKLLEALIRRPLSLAAERASLDIRREQDNWG